MAGWGRGCGWADLGVSKDTVNRARVSGETPETVTGRDGSDIQPREIVQPNVPRRVACGAMTGRGVLKIIQTIL
jgi:hypothetical protein